MARLDRRGREIYNGGEYVIVLQENRAAYRVARIERLLRRGQAFEVRFWRWGEARWSGRLTVERHQILGRHEGGRETVPDVALALQAFANMRAAAIRQADADQLEHVCSHLKLDPLVATGCRTGSPPAPGAAKRVKAG